jgi:RNA polymerase sigma factor
LKEIREAGKTLREETPETAPPDVVADDAVLPVEAASPDARALLARTDAQAMNDLIADYRNFILASASRVCRRPIDPDNDDEFSTAMLAFYEAIRLYEPSRGAFLAFARSVIRTRLIDGFRKTGRRPPEVPIDDEGDDEEEYRADPTIHAAVDAFQREVQVRERRDEIARFTVELSAWDLTLRDLADASPKAAKTRVACGALVRELLDDDALRDQFLRTRQLPLAALCQRSGVPRKIAERHRRYIVSVILVLGGDYPYMAEHLRWMKARK